MNAMRKPAIVAAANSAPMALTTRVGQLRASSAAMPCLSATRSSRLPTATTVAVTTAGQHAEGCHFIVEAQHVERIDHFREEQDRGRRQPLRRWLRGRVAASWQVRRRAPPSLQARRDRGALLNGAVKARADDEGHERDHGEAEGPSGAAAQGSELGKGGKACDDQRAAGPRDVDRSAVARRARVKGLQPERDGGKGDDRPWHPERIVA